jgi:hypothetical protein
MQIPAEEWSWEAEIAKRISMLSNGGFFWVVLLVDTILAKQDEGSSLVAILTHVNQMPLELGELYTKILQESPTAEKAVTNKIFQCALGAARPLLFDEWHHVLGFCQRACSKVSPGMACVEGNIGGDQQLERPIRTMYGSLLELSRTSIDRNMAVTQPPSLYVSVRNLWTMNRATLVFCKSFMSRYRSASPKDLASPFC